MDKLTQHKVGVVYDEYGEILKTIIIKDDEDIEIINKKRRLQESQLNYINNKNELHKQSCLLGGYVHMAYVKNELLFNNIGIDRANISRLIYLSTYIDYNNRQENLLIKYTQNNKVKPLSKYEIKKLLKLNDTAFKSFMADVIKHNLIIEEDGFFYISNDYFSKGLIDKSKLNNKEYTRIFIDTTRMLFENCTSRQHKQLSYIYQLIPFMNFELNVICSNPHETDFYELDKLSLIQICKLLGTSTVKSSMNKLENNLLKFHIKIDGKKYYLFKRVIVKGGNGKFDYFIINPYVIWGGKDTDKVKDTLQTLLFK
ncbi:Uncharacterised protein [[Clostridium] sordellii]|uniref:hypothetical protein n=1 Tax=Paraclostridium sordellii TaxID=1505 RepID=UPI0005DFE913|nr:hypothetical protein [Paeniclostridium sordellii]CEQ01712.1 Uncharacterised protein [[Clostridium] sordellii] [Paeniclostridium sordellii]